MTMLQDITNFAYWYLDDLRYQDGTLTIEIVEGAASEKADDLKIGEATIENVHAIETSPDSRRFRIVFDDVVLFAGYDELQHLPEPAETIEPGLISRYSESRLLRFADEHTDTIKMTVGEVRHYCIRTGEFWVNVLTREQPIVKAVEF